MPPQVALLICIVFVSVLLRIDRIHSANTTWVLWIPTIWILYSASKPLGIWFPGSGTDFDSSPLDRTFLLILLGLALTTLFLLRANWFSALSSNRLVLLIFLYMLLSVVWSDLPFVSLKRFSREVLVLLLGLLVATEPDPKEALITLLRRIAYCLLPFSIMLIKYFPEYGVEYGRWSGMLMWIGVAQQKNSLGALCSISILYLLWSRFQDQGRNDVAFWNSRTIPDLLILALALWLLGGPNLTPKYSATSTAALSFALAIYGLAGYLKKKGRDMTLGLLGAILSVIIILGVTAPFFGGLPFDSLTGTLGRDETLTGRTEVWLALAPVALNSIVLGYGVNSFWTSNTRAYFDISGAHNGYLDVLLSLGLCGLLLIVFFLFSSLRRAHSLMQADFSFGVLWICLLFMVTVHNITESSLHSWTITMSAFLLLFPIGLTKSMTVKLRE